MAASELTSLLLTSRPDGLPKPMLHHSARVSLSLFLSALMMAWTLAPPGVRHAHGGVGNWFAHHEHDQPNQLDTANCDWHGEDVHHRHDSARAEAPRTPTLSALDEIWHWHLTLLGIDFTLPEPNGPAGDRHDPRPDQMVTVRAANDFLPNVQGRTGFDRPSISSDCLALHPDDVTALLAVAESPPPVTTALLCDSARFERSGVLLV